MFLWSYESFWNFKIFFCYVYLVSSCVFLSVGHTVCFLLISVLSVQSLKYGDFQFRLEVMLSGGHWCFLN